MSSGAAASQPAGDSLSSWVLLHLPTLTTLTALIADPNNARAQLATFSMPRDLIEHGISDELLYRAKISKATEYGLDVKSVNLVGTYYMIHGHALLSAKITCGGPDIFALRKAIGFAGGIAPGIVTVECGESTKLGTLVTGLNREHKMYNISTLVPVSYGVKIGRYAVPHDLTAVQMAERIGSRLKETDFLENLKTDGMDVTKVESVDAPYVTADITFSVPRGMVPPGQVKRMARARAAARAASEAGAKAYATAKARGATALGAAKAADAALGAAFMSSRANDKADEAMAEAVGKSTAEKA